MNEHILKYNGPVPEGYELTGEVRVPAIGELILETSADNVRAKKVFCVDSLSIILRSKCWRPEEGETYWFVDGTTTVNRRVRGDRLESDAASKAVEMGRCFRTQAAAEAVAEKIRTIFQEAQ